LASNQPIARVEDIDLKVKARCGRRFARLVFRRPRRGLLSWARPPTEPPIPDTASLFHANPPEFAKRHRSGKPRSIRNKTYPLAVILDGILYNLGHTLAEAAAKLKSRHGHTIAPSTLGGTRRCSASCSPMIP
jgi:hypothetical protein